MNNKCFELDWSCGKYNNFIKNDEDRETLKEFMRSKYGQMRLAYKFASSYSNNPGLWFIGSNGITEIFSQMGLLDGKRLTLSSLDIEFEKVNYSTEKGLNNVRGCIVRFEFMEMMVIPQSFIPKKNRSESQAQSPTVRAENTTLGPNPPRNSLNFTRCHFSINFTINPSEPTSYGAKRLIIFSNTIN
jgi:hypothetical protein